LIDWSNTLFARTSPRIVHNWAAKACWNKPHRIIAGCFPQVCSIHLRHMFECSMGSWNQLNARHV
jgi:hypothetical protein